VPPLFFGVSVSPSSSSLEQLLIYVFFLLGALRLGFSAMRRFLESKAVPLASFLSRKTNSFELLK
jgi:hypothetical protein